MTEAIGQGVFVDTPEPDAGFWGDALTGLNNLSTGFSLIGDITGVASEITNDIADGRANLDRQQQQRTEFEQDQKIDWLGFKRGDNLVRYGVMAVAGIGIILLVK